MAYNLLKGKRGIITGALDENSIAWKVAEKAHEEGATFVLTNAPIAMRMGEINKLAEKTGSQIIVECLKKEGVDTLFHYPGGAVLPLFDELHQSPIQKMY